LTTTTVSGPTEWIILLSVVVVVVLSPLAQSSER
jgi:hypothetical protein